VFYNRQRRHSTLAISPRLSLRRDRLSRNQVSTKSGEDQILPRFVVVLDRHPKPGA
jgi:hypothetical protein